MHRIPSQRRVKLIITLYRNIKIRYVNKNKMTVILNSINKFLPFILKLLQKEEINGSSFLGAMMPLDK